MRIFIREITAKSGRRYRIYSEINTIYSLDIFVKVRLLFLGFIPIWTTLSDNGNSERYGRIIRFNDYVSALKCIDEIELLNNRFYEKKFYEKNNLSEKTDITQKVIDDVYERN